MPLEDYIGLEYEFHQEANDLISSLQTDVANLQVTPTQKPAAPGSSISFDPVSGDDANDGFTGAVLTLDRVAEILTLYNWQGGIANITAASFFNLTTNTTLDFTEVTNLRIAQFSFFLAGGQSSATLKFQNFKHTTLTITDLTLVGAGELVYENGKQVNASLLGASATTGSSPFRLLFVEEVSFDMGTIANPTGLSELISLNNIGYFNLDINTLTAVTASNALIKVDENVGVIKISPSGESLTGALISSLPESGLRNIIGFTNITGSVASTIEPHVPIDGTITRGTFDDDAAAGVGGLVTGEYYETTGAGAAPLNVAGLVVRKQ